MSGGCGKRVEKGTGEVAAFGPFRLFPTARRLERDDKPVEIGGRALDVLIELVKQAGRVVSKADLMSMIWADTTVVEGVLRTHVYNLRKALGDGVAGARYVTSVAGRGYCFVAPVVHVVEATSPASPNDWKLPHGLPPRLARMAGRDDTVRMLAAHLAEHRFVTVLGAAGIGKTTVAVAVGRALLDDFGGAVRFIELGSLTDPALVAATVASTLGVPMHTDEALESLRAFLQDKRVLLVLDNCEHLIDAAASLAEHLFLRTPQVHLLTTSREALRAEGEHAYRLVSLETPTEVLGMSAEAVQTFPAVQVFLERAAASGWSGDLTDDDVPIVAGTCRRLDGVPLALELAASFVGQYGLQGMATVLDDRLRLLWQHGRRTAPPRQQTIHALVAWSYDRLPERECVVLRRLSVFVGAFPFDAARAVALERGDSDESLLELMNDLVAKSLLSASVADGAVVYRLLETTRVYAFERLAESAELERMSLRHALLFTERLARAADLGNVRVALKWSFSSPAGHSAGARLAAAAARTLIDLGLMTECYDWCRRALDVLGAPDTGTLVELRLREALAVSAMFTRGNGNEVLVALKRGLEIARALGGLDHEVRLLEHLNVFLVRIGDYRGALEVALSSIDAAQRASKTSEMTLAELMLGRSYHLCGNQTLAQEHLDMGLRLAAASVEVPTMIFNDAYTDALLTLTRPLLLRGHADRAVAVARQLLDENARPTPPVNKCLRLIYCEQVFIWRGEWDEAERLLEVLAEHVERYSLSSYRGVEGALRGELLVKTCRPGDGCNLLKIGVSSLKAARNATLDTLFAGALADGLAAIGSLSEALSTVEAALELAKGRGGTWDMPELLRRSGVFLASRSRRDARAGDEAMSAAIELARRQGALAWELRATMALARERLRRGGSPDVMADLSTVYAQFSEGLDAPDLQAARSLLEGRVDR
jgi:predicted ATPase/DNA-binding winged helix-turn-helix (wHTH) protein